MDIRANYYTESGSVIFEIMDKKDIENFNENANTIFQMESDGTVDSNLVPKLESYNDNKVSINYANNGFSTYLGELPVILEFDVDDIENVEVSYVDPEDFS